ncbi:MAG: acireductone synthase [Myxococcales bacterium]|nr:acireductone synthase [Myxococcales bacterium]
MSPVRVVLTDIEGTTSAITFVHEVLFPYARARLPSWVEAHAHEPRVQAVLDAMRAEAGTPEAGRDEVVATLLGWIDADRKATPLKTLQGWIWEEGYRDGAYRAHVYADAVEGLRRWHRAGLRLAVYSSGSVHAQQLFFGHSVAGDLQALFSGWFDTTTGPKRDPSSYAAIAHALAEAPAAILFLSDVGEELDAARAAGLRTTWVVRRGALPTSSHPVVRTFDGVHP